MIEVCGRTPRCAKARQKRKGDLTRTTQASLPSKARESHPPTTAIAFESLVARRRRYPQEC